MLPMLFPVDARDYPFLKSRRERGDGRGAARRERDLLAANEASLVSEVQRLQEENEALRTCAAIWIRLYERQLERANAAENTRRSLHPGTTDSPERA